MSAQRFACLETLSALWADDTLGSYINVVILGLSPLAVSGHLLLQRPLRPSGRAPRNPLGVLILTSTLQEINLSWESFFLQSKAFPLG